MGRSATVRLLLAASLVLALVSPTSSSPRTWHIKPDGTGDVPTIQDTFDLASSGDVIELADGICRGDGNRDVDFLGCGPIALTPQTWARVKARYR